MLSDELRDYVKHLSVNIGERNCYKPDTLDSAARWIEMIFKSYGYRINRQYLDFDKEKFKCKVGNPYNIIAEIKGTVHPEKILIVGAHYDSKVAMPGWKDHFNPCPEKQGTPGANDNASGIAALLALARLSGGRHFHSTIRFCAFVNEEPPFFKDKFAMGSYVYARQCRLNNEEITGAIILDALGTYSPHYGVKRKKYALLPDLLGLDNKSDYLAFLGNLASRKFMGRCAEIFQKKSDFPFRQVSIPAISPLIAWSDDWSFWKCGYPAFTITDTAYLRSDDYHELSDTEEKLDYSDFADAVKGIQSLIIGILDYQSSFKCNKAA